MRAPLRRQLRLDGLLAYRGPLLLQTNADFQLLGRNLGLGERHLIGETLFRHLFLRQVLGPGLLVIRCHRGGASSLRERLVLQLHFKVGVLGLGGANLRFGVEHILLELRVAELEQHRVRLDLLTGQQKAAVDPALIPGGYKKNVLRHQRAQTADVEHHVAAPDRVDEGRAVDRGRGRLEPRETERNHAYRRDGHDGINDAANPALSDEIFTRNIQAELLFDGLRPFRYRIGARGEPSARRSWNLLKIERLRYVSFAAAECEVSVNGVS